MEVNMNQEEVVIEIQRLNSIGENLNKKKIKKSHPQLMRNALHYFPDWDSALNKSNTL